MQSLSFLRLAFLTTALIIALSVGLGLTRDDVGRRTERLMGGTAYEARMHVFDSGVAGTNLLVLGGVHGNEPGAWLAAQRLVDGGLVPRAGKVVVVPRANARAVEMGVRSTPQIGDLNRLYFADADVFPMARMAREITDVVERHEIDVVLDLHESWDFHDPSAEGVRLSALGQTISPHASEPSRSMVRALVEAVNAALPKDEAFLYHEFPPGHVDALIVPLPPGVPESAVPRKSGLEIPERYPEVASILVEVGQQQPLERRIAQQVAVVEALMALLGEQRAESR